MSARSPRNRKKAHGLGILAERFAIVLLRLNGYRILACRYRVQGGEIDIVARRARHDRFRRSEGTANSRRGQDRDRLRQTPAYLPRGENLARYEPLGGAVDVARRRRLHRALALAASRDRGIRTESGISAYLGKRGEAFSFRHSARSRPAKLSMKAFRICVLVHLQASISLNEASLQGSSGGGPNSTFHASSKDFFTQ
jgi:hypothetical protein